MRRIWLSILLVGLLLVIAGCAERPFGDKTVVEWSRGRVIGQSIQAEPVAFEVAESGDWLALAWVAVSTQSEASVLHFAVMDDQGTMLSDLDLDLDLVEPSSPKLVLSSGELVDLFWLDKIDHIERLFHARMTTDGHVRMAPAQVSEEGYRVNGFDAVRLPSGELLVVWANRDGLRAALFGEDGQTALSQTLEAPAASLLDAVVGEAGEIHVAWQQSFSRSERRMYYSKFDPTSMSFSWPEYLVTVVLKAGSSLSGSAEQLLGPVVSLEPEHLLIAWAVGEVQGSDYKASAVRYTPGAQRELAPRKLSLPGRYQPAYEEAVGSLPYLQLAPPLAPGVETGSTTLHTGPATVQSQSGEVPIAVSMWLRSPWSPQLQPALVVLEEGKPKGFQVVGWTRYPSLHPNLEADGQGNLYYAWLDATGSSFPVYLATTAPDLRARLDHVGQEDLMVALERLFGRVISALGLVFLGLSWLILPGFFLILVLFVLREDSLRTTKGMIAFLALIGLHWAGKYLFTPGLLATLPKARDLPLIFPLLTVLAPQVFAWLPNQLALPAFVAPLAPFIVPSVTVLAGVALASWLYIRPSKYPNLVPAYLILALVDVFLALQIYALTFHDPAKF